MSEVRIVDWNDKYHQHFIDISVEWLETYVSVEPEDLKILYDPQKSVFDAGGQIFFALVDGQVVGTVAMIKEDRDTFELAKLAVRPKYKGQGIGELLMRKCIAFAKESLAKTIILYTNHKLIPAIHLYEKIGFSKVSFSNNKYLESDMKMQLQL